MTSPHTEGPRLTVDDVSAAARLPADGEDGEQEGEHADEGDQDDQAEHARHIALPGRVAHDGTVACEREEGTFFCFLLLRLLLRCHCHTHADSSAFGTSPLPSPQTSYVQKRNRAWIPNLGLTHINLR